MSFAISREVRLWIPPSPATTHMFMSNRWPGERIYTDPDARQRQSAASPASSWSSVTHAFMPTSTATTKSLQSSRVQRARPRSVKPSSTIDRCSPRMIRDPLPPCSLTSSLLFLRPPVVSVAPITETHGLTILKLTRDSVSLVKIARVRLVPIIPGRVMGPRRVIRPRCARLRHQWCDHHRHYREAPKGRVGSHGRSSSSFFRHSSMSCRDAHGPEGVSLSPAPRDMVTGGLCAKFRRVTADPSRAFDPMEVRTRRPRSIRRSKASRGPGRSCRQAGFSRLNWPLSSS